MVAGATALAKNLHKWLDHERAEKDLDAYFAEPYQAAPGDPVYSGRFFERLDGGGDRPAVCERFTAADLLAVQMLSVDVPPETTIGILHGRLGRTLSRRLHEIPTDIALGDPEAREHLVDNSPADQAWRLLKDQKGAGYVTAGKLLARKRPNLIPVYDSVVKCALEEPHELWLGLQAVLADPDTGIRGRLAELRAACRVPAEVGELRVLDVVVWKGHRGHHSRARCTAPGTAALTG